MPGIEALAGGPVGLGVSSGLQAIMGVAQMVQAGKQRREAERLARNLVRPEYNIAQPIKDNQALAESRASQGLSDAAMSTYENNMDRTLTTSIDAILRGGGSASTIGELYDGAEDRFANLALLEEEIRMKNTQLYMNANERMGDELDKQFQINEYAPYKDTQQAIAQLRAQASQNQSNGLNTITGSVANYVQANMYKNDIDGVYGRPASGGGYAASPIPGGVTQPAIGGSFIPVNPVAPNVFGTPGWSPYPASGSGIPSYGNYMQSLIPLLRR